MNRVELIGRLTRDPEVRETKDGLVISRYTLAVDAGKDKDANFISCVAFGNGGKFVEKYFKRGQRVGIAGSIVTGRYEDKDGVAHYTFEVVSQEHYFCDGSREDTRNENRSNSGSRRRN